MQIQEPKSPTCQPSRRELHAFSIAEDGDGERLPVLASFPAHVDDAAGVAALVEAAAVDAGLEFVDFLKLVAAAEPPPIGKLFRRVRAEGPAHRPPRDWAKVFGKSLASLGLMTFVYGRLRPAMTKAAVRRAVLVGARDRARKHRLTDDDISKEAERLKQALR